ncbi:MAG: nucleotide exchange factor GrpE [Chloroflexota bacterium]
MAEAEDTARSEGAAPAEDATCLGQALADEKAKAEKCLANWQRSEADLINYKRQAERERNDLRESANSALVLSLLPVLDDLDWALASLAPKLARHNWVDGIKLVRQKLISTLEAAGLSRIETKGQSFDPRFHEAVLTREGQDGAILEEVQRGYMFRGRVLRPARVVVGSDEAAREPSTPEGG